MARITLPAALPERRGRARAVVPVAVPDPGGRRVPVAAAGAGRPGWRDVVASAMAVGTVASLATVGVLALLARAEGRGAVQPINATSHWLHGPRAGAERGVDPEHTGIGYATHHASAVFWAVPFEWWRTRAERRPGAVLAGAGAVAALAAAVDYGLIHRRLTPGWEHAVSPRAVGTTFGALALGLAAGGLMVGALRRR